MILGLDLGGTNIRGAIIHNDTVSTISSARIRANATAEDVLRQLFEFTDTLFHSSVRAIGIGVPGLIDPVTGMVYDVVNIPSWKEMPLQVLMEERYKVPVLVNNDANCFAMGEFYFGKGRGHDSMVGLTIGTGLGSGMIFNKKLYAGANGGSGEFGMISYLDHCYEFYASGQYFKNVYNTEGEVVFEQAKTGNPEAIRMYEEMGTHLGNAITMILYAVDTELIVLGGSVRHASEFFSAAMWNQVNKFAFKRSLKNLKIEVSELENSGVLGAAALHLENLQ